MYNSTTIQSTTSDPSISFRLVESITPLFTKDYQPLENVISIDISDFDKDIYGLAFKYAKSRPSNLETPEDYPPLVPPGCFDGSEPIATYSKDVEAILVDSDGERFEYSLDYGEEYEHFAAYAVSQKILSQSQVNKLADLLRIEYIEANTSEKTTITYRLVESLTPLFTDNFEPLEASFIIPIKEFERDFFMLAINYAQANPLDFDIPEGFPEIVPPGLYSGEEPVSTFSKSILAIIKDEEGNESTFNIDSKDGFEEFASYCKMHQLYNEDQISTISKFIIEPTSIFEYDLDELMPYTDSDYSNTVVLRIEKSIRVTREEGESLIKEHQDYLLEIYADIWDEVKEAADYLNESWRSIEVSEGQSKDIKSYKWDLILLYADDAGQMSEYSYTSDGLEELHEILPEVLELSQSEAEIFADHLSLRLLGYNDDMFIHDEQEIENLREEYIG